MKLHTFEFFRNLPDRIEAVLVGIKVIIFAFMAHIGPLFVGAIPASFMGYAVFSILYAATKNLYLSVAFGLNVGLGIEVVNFVVVSTAVDMYDGAKQGLVAKGKFHLMIILVPVAATLVSIVVYNAKDAFGSDSIRYLGTFSSWLVIIVYSAVALSNNLRLIKRQAETETQKAETEAERIRLKTEAEELRAKRIEDEEREAKRKTEAFEREQQLRADVRQEREDEHRRKMELKAAEQAGHEAEHKRAMEFERQRDAIPVRTKHLNTQHKTRSSVPYSPDEKISPKDRDEMAREIILGNPKISGAELGRILGLSERMGQLILKRLLEETSLPVTNSNNGMH